MGGESTLHGHTQWVFAFLVNPLFNQARDLHPSPLHVLKVRIHLEAELCIDRSRALCMCKLEAFARVTHAIFGYGLKAVRSCYSRPSRLDSGLRFESCGTTDGASFMEHWLLPDMLIIAQYCPKIRVTSRKPETGQNANRAQCPRCSSAAR